MNSSRNKVLLLIIAILLISNIVLLVFLFGTPKTEKPVSHERQHRMSDYLKNEVGFSPQQMSSYEQLRKEQRERMKPVFEDIKNTKINFYLNLNDSLLPGADLDSMASPIGDKQTMLDARIMRYFISVRNLCTPEQKPRFDSIYPIVIRRMMEWPRRGNDRRSTDSTSKDAQ